jgi:hypothetical protein
MAAWREGGMDRGTRSRTVRDVIANPTPEETAQIEALKQRLRGVGPRTEPLTETPIRDATARAPTLDEIEDVVRRVLREELDARGL